MFSFVAILAGVALVNSVYGLPSHDRNRKTNAIYPRIQFHCNCPIMDNKIISQHDPSDEDFDHTMKFDPRQNFARENKATHQACALLQQEYPGVFETQMISNREEGLPITDDFCIFWKSEGGTQEPWTIFNNQFCKEVDPNCDRLTFYDYRSDDELHRGRNIPHDDLMDYIAEMKDE